MPARDKARSSEIFLEDLAAPLANEIVNAVSAILLSKKLASLPPNSPLRKRVEAPGGVIPVIINCCINELAAMRSRAKSENRPFTDVFCSEAGWALVRLLRDAGKALLESGIKSSMTAKASDDRKYYADLILRLKRYVACMDGAAAGEPSAVRPNTADSAAVAVKWDKPVPKLTPGPDLNGDIGMAKLQPVASDPIPLNEQKPAPPKRSQRRQVKTTPAPNRRTSDKEFTPRQERLYLQLNAEMVRQKFPDLDRSKPHYMCEHCGFVGTDRTNDFRLDHVLEVQFGGTRDQWTEQTAREVYEGGQVSAVYEQGVNGMIICDGCNQAKKTDGFLKEGKGFAYTRRNEDLNPDHIYQGGPDGKSHQ